MRDFILFMHDDTTTAPVPEMWSSYFTALRRLDAFEGGSAIDSGLAYRKEGKPGSTSGRLTGYIKVRAKSLTAARKLLTGNPVFECGGTVEIRELSRD